MHIEDLLRYLHTHGNLNFYDTQIVDSFVNQVFNNSRGFTEKQNSLAIKIISKYSSQLSLAIGKDVNIFLNNPTYRIPLRVSNRTKNISCIDFSNWGRSFKVTFPYDQEKISQIKSNRSDLALHSWDPIESAWMFAAHEKNILFLSKFIENQNFEVDEEFGNYLDQLQIIIKNIENYVPMLSLDSGVPKYQNISKFTPELKSKEVISALFEARKAGILTWSDQIDQYLDQTKVHEVTKRFLSHGIKKGFEIPITKYDISCLTDIVKNLFPVIFVIPGGSELEKTKLVYEFLISIGFTGDDISVLFRTSNRDQKDFNNFVKNCGLNNPITKKTKFAFISAKLPKPLLYDNLNFNSLINMGNNSVHYSIRNLIKKQENMIHYSESSGQWEIDFASL